VKEKRKKRAISNQENTEGVNVPEGRKGYGLGGNKIEGRAALVRYRGLGTQFRQPIGNKTPCVEGKRKRRERGRKGKGEKLERLPSDDGGA